MPSFFEQQIQKVKCNKGRQFVSKIIDPKIRIDEENYMHSSFGDPDYKGNIDLVNDYG